MKKILKWLGLGVGGLLVLALLVVVGVYLIVAARLSEKHEVAGVEVPVPDSPADVAEGERLARILGCNNGCHGKGGSHGGIFFEVPDGTKVVAPDLHRLAAEYSIPDLDRAIRHGVKPDGTTLIGAMPSEMFYHLSDRQLGQVIAYLRSRPPGEGSLPASRVGPLARLLLLQAYWFDGWQIYAARAIDHDAPRLSPDPSDAIGYGRYLAQTSCTECHGQTLEGSPADGIPNLAVAAAYSKEDFTRLMRTGKPMGGRELELMALVAEKRFAHFTDSEIDALYAYLRQRGGATTAAGAH